jgi:uncharacterized protein with PIN domain
LQRALRFLQPNQNEPLIFCGDFNSRPGGLVHQYLSKGWVDGRQAAPWYNHCSEEKVDMVELNTHMNQLQLSPDVHAPSSSPPPPMRYILDATLNKLCRWLRILGVDAALETEEEERQRTKEGTILIFDRCRLERRTLVTTSTRLMHRRDCPAGAYCINPTILPHLEVAMIHLFLTHGIVLEPEKFLSRCVVCNGDISVVQDTQDKRNVLKEYQAPEELSEDLEVYQCNGCRQGYWWCDRPTSSASRVKNAATHLFEQCLRAGVPYQGSLGMFDFVDPEKARSQRWDSSTHDASSIELLQQTLLAGEWLRSERLSCPYEFQSAYATYNPDTDTMEELPFTNVTHDFVNTLDYIFYETQKLEVTELYSIPKTFEELNPQKIANGHLLPSDVWPSDHLLIGASVRIKHVKAHTDETVVESPTNAVCPVIAPTTTVAPSNTENHGARCACGCVPPIRSLFEMAELRKQAKAKKDINVVDG